MQVVSGPIGKEHVHFEAPKAERLDAEMSAFLDWFERQHRIDPVLKAALAHLWFVTIHPFEDGNGRIARAIADMALARSEQQPATLLQHVGADPAGAQRLLRHPGADAERNAGHHALDGVVPGLPGPRYRRRQTTLAAPSSPRRASGSASRTSPLNDRQRLVLNRLLDGFEGKLTTSKYAKLAKCSQDTALRDILALVERGILVRNPEGGRSTSYSLAPVK